MGELSTLRDILSANPGATLDELVGHFAAAGRPLRPRQVEVELRRAGAVELASRWWLPEDSPPARGGPSAVGSGEEQPAGGDERGRQPGAPARARVVVFDLETVVRQVAAAPYLERHVFQIGAVRTGRDRDWVRADEHAWSAYVRLPEIADPLLESASVRERYEAAAQEPAAALDALLAYAAGATHLVAYNGTGLDFEVIEALCRRHGRSLPAGIRLVDGLYLAQALWPVPPNDHRLHRLLERLSIDVGELFWHDARDDSIALTLLLNAGQRLVRSWVPRFAALVQSAGTGSDAWDLLFDLVPEPAPRREFADAEVREVIAAEMTKPPVRDPDSVGRQTPDDGESAGSAPRPVAAGPRRSLSLPPEILGPDGRVDVFLLAKAAKPDLARPRPSQERMVAAMRRHIDAGRPALVEAPTGTGKSYAMLAVALDWLAADPAHRVVMSTFTKALQSQLADDLERIGSHVPGLLELTDVVKGSGNRLSLRGLLIAVADLASARPAERIRGRPDYTADPRYRDLVLYLLLRLRAESTRRSEEWLAHSVDAVDVPPMFEQYIGDGRRGLYLAHLSQASQGELGTRAGDLALHTSTVSQSLDENRLIVANHALLLAHLDVFEELGPDTLLLIDEAHALETAATQALSATVATPELWRLVRDVREWLNDVPAPDRTPLHADLRRWANALDQYLDAEALQQGGRRALDTVPSDGLASAGHARRVVVDSRLTGAMEQVDMAALKQAVRDAYAELDRIDGTLRDLPSPADPFERDRFLALRTRTRELARSLALIEWDLYELDGGEEADAGAAAGEHGGGGDGPAGGAQDGQDGGAGEDAGAAGGARRGRGRRRPARRARSDEGPSNQVVWVEEIPSDRPLTVVSDLRFRLWTSPVELGRDAVYRAFRAQFPRTYYISATLRVGRDPARAFDFTRDRLALARDSVGEEALESPFDAAANARLVVFDDFPSWTEQAEAATRTVAHQVARYGEAMLAPDPTGEAAGLLNGAMVLTTSRSAASEIGAHLVRARAASGHPLASADILGTRRAVEQFKADGGILVGTKGLWQGVDIDRPVGRLRLVWINKLPFPSFEDPIVKTRRALVALQAGGEDPDGAANERYYLPLAAIELRQAVGRLLRTERHQGVVVISDRKLAGPTRLRRLYREVFLGSLDPGLLLPDPETGEAAGGNVASMAEGWRRIWRFFESAGILDPSRAEALCAPDALEVHTQLPETRAIRALRLPRAEEDRLRADGGEAALTAEVARRCEAIGGLLTFRDGPIELKDEQRRAIEAVAAGRDLLGLLPTGYGKSFVFQLPALATEGVTIVVSPLVSLMTDQALELNRAIGGAVRALVAPMRESNSRTGKVEVQQQLAGTRDHGIRLVYLSPERLCSRQFQDWIRAGVASGQVRRIAIDEAHTLVTWGDDFRPSFRRAERFLRELKAARPDLQLLALTASATATVRSGLRRSVFGLPEAAPGAPPPADPPTFAQVQANPLRANLALWTRRLGRAEGGPIGTANAVLSVVSRLDRHAIVYCLTVREAVATHNLIRNALGEAQRRRVHLYHGRLPDTAKAAVANAFRAAPVFDPKEPGEFEPVIVVATSAFGLGINRPDVRTVFCTSPAMDLSALYQQVGRGGRDGAPAAGLMLATGRGFRTLRFMSRRDVARARVAEIAGEILGHRDWVRTGSIAERLAAEDLRAGRTDEEHVDRHADQLAVLVVRVLAELAAAGVVEDLGDYPARVRLLRGTVAPDTTDYAEIAAAVWDAVTEPAAQSVVELHEALAPRFGDELPDPGATFSMLLALHAEGIVEVSQMVEGHAADRGPVTGIRHTGAPVPADLIDRLAARGRDLAAEVALVERFFSAGRCVNERFAAYFGAPVLPAMCAQPPVRCSWHWNTAEGSADAEPPLLAAFLRPAASFTGREDFRRRELRDLPALVEDLLRYRRRGLAANVMGAVLRGQTHYTRRDRTRKALWPELVENRFFGRLPTLRRAELDGALASLEGAGRILRDGGIYQHPDAVAAMAADEERRAARRAAAEARAQRDRAAAGSGAPA